MAFTDVAADSPLNQGLLVSDSDSDSGPPFLQDRPIEDYSGTKLNCGSLTKVGERCGPRSLTVPLVAAAGNALRYDGQAR